MPDLHSILWRTGPRGLLVWQWLALLGLLLVAWIVGRTLGRITAAVARRLASRTETHWDDVIVDSLHGPLTLAWTVAAVWLGLPLLEISGTAEDSLQDLLRAIFFAAFFWSLLRLVEVGRQFLGTLPW